MIEDINERMVEFSPSQNNQFNDDPIARKIATARQVPTQQESTTIEVDDVARRIAQNRRDLMMATLGSAAEANPDQAAQAKKLGEQFGVGADIAGRNMQQLKKQALLDELERRDLMRRDPILARYLSNHDFAAMAHDDIDNLAKTEDLFQGSWFARYEDPIAYGKKTISMIDERFRRGRAIVEMGRANDLLGLRAQWSPDPRKASEISEELKKLTTEGGIVGAGVEVVGQMLEGIPEVAETTAMGATAGGALGAVGGPAGFLTIPAGMLTGAGAGFAAGSARSAFMAESGNSYQQMIEQGYDPEVARKAAIGVGVVNASIEMISFGALGPVLRKLGVNVFRPAVANALAKPTAAKALAILGADYAKAVAAGGGEELLQEIATGIGDDIARVYGSSSPSRILDDGGITDLLGTAIESGVQGAMGMAILGGIGPVANFRYDMRRAGAAERQQAFFERLSSTAVDSKLRGRDMNAFERFVASQAEGTEAETIFVDAAAMQGVLRQSNLSDEQIDEALPGVREQLQAAAQTGGDVTLPTASFAARVAGTDLGNAMLPHVRLAPDAMSVTEAQEFQKNRDQLVEQARVIMEEKGRADDAFVQEARAIEDRIYQEVVATGTMDENAARANATFVRDLYVTMAARMNTTPAALEQRFPYRVEAQGVAITDPLEQADQFDQAGERRTDTPEFKAWFRESKVATPEGLPIPVYHGTHAKFDAFDPARAGSNVNRPISGFYFSDESDIAASYGPNIIKAYLSIQNPYIVDFDGANWDGTIFDEETGEEVQVIPSMDELVEEAKQLGYDGVIAENVSDVGALTGAGDDRLLNTTFVVFDPTQIKSPNNRGTWSRATANIMQQAATMDAEYMAAVERGDMATAQQQTDATAERSFPESVVRGDGDIGTAGKILRVYHGSGAFIRQFMYEFTGQGVDQLGSGFYFTTDRPEAESYMTRRRDGETVKIGGESQPTVVEAYLDIRNPLRADKVGSITREQVRKFIAAAPVETRREGLENWGIDGDVPSSKVLDAYAFKDANIVRELFKIGNDFYGRNTEAFNRAIKDVLGYDGVVQDFRADGVKKLHYVAFFPEQIKSADPVTYDEAGNVIPLSRRFDITSPRIFEQLPVTPGFYSALEREVAAIDAKALTASGWAERFKGLLAKGAIKADELEWSGLADYLKMQEGKVSKDAVLEFLRGNGVRVERMISEQARYNRQPLVLPGGTNYREVLLTLPAGFQAPMPAVSPEGLAAREAIFAKYAPRLAELEREGNSLMFAGRALTDEEAQRLADVRNERDELEEQRNAEARAAYKIPERPAAPDFRTTHWEQPNVLVHLRMNDRVDADGKRVLFVEEVQSDWGQEGKKKGFRPTMTLAEVQASADADRRKFYAGKFDMSDEEWSALSKRVREWNELENRVRSGITRAPFVNNTDGWLNLGLKQVLLEAVRGNYDRVAFVNGEQSANRYDLSQQVDVVNVSRGGGTTWEIWADKDGQMVVREDVKTIEEVEEVLGKELAAKVADMKPGESARTFSGVDLKVGGEGMKAFYDKIVPIAMGKLLKKYVGVKLGSVMLPNMRQQEMETDAERMGMTIEDVLDVADESEYAQAQLGFDITPEMVKKLESGLPLFQAARGPARGGFDPSRLTTILNKNADLSTFIHETAHFYLTIIGNLAADPAATREIRADMDTLLKWFGIAGDTDAARLAAWNAMSVDQQRKYHEQFAYSFEVYMFEGKSPSAEMQGLFDRFSAWLKRVYRSIRDDLNAIYRREFGEDLPLLTGEVRQVMDRMLASEEQIKRQAAINEMKPMFQTQEQSGMDDAEWAAYQQMQQEAVEAAVTDMNKASLRQMQWLSNARARILRDLQSKHAKQRKEIREEVAEEIRRQPLYRAMEYLRTGTFTDADGEAVKMEGAHRLDMESVRQMYAQEPENLRPDIAKLGTGGRGMMGMNGIDPDVAAELFGFSSGDELIRALIEAQPMKEAIDARTDELMLERFSELSTPEGREAKVQESLHNEARARFVAVELRFVAKATQPARVLVEAAKQAAREMIAGKRIADLRPSEFIAAEARAARAAGKIGKPVNVDAVAQAAYTRAKNEALASGAPEDVAEAGAVVARDAARAAAQARLDEQRAQYGADPEQALIRAKRAQLYQNQLAAEALAARDEVEKGVRYLRQVMRDSNVKRMGADVADQIDRILERFNLRPMSAKRMAERQSLVQWLESLKESGLEPDLAPEILDEAARKPYREMTVAEFRDLVDAVKQLEYIGKNAQKIKRAQEMAEFEEVRDEIVASVRGNFTGKETKPRTPTTSMGKRIAKAKRFLYSHLKAAAIARIMDGGQDDGPVWNFLIRTANEAGDMETKMRAEATKRLTEILAPVFALGKMGGKGIYFDTVGMSLNREARLVIALNMGNDGNRQRLLDGEGWTLEQVQPILESLTEAEWKAVQDVWDYMESFRPLVGAKERRLYGREPKWVTPVPFTVRTADGKEVRLSGGYYPIKYDPIATERAETADEAEKARTELRGAYTAATTRRSFTKARAAKVEDRPLLYTMTGVYSGINDVIHDLAWHEWLIQANRLMRDEKFDRAVRETYGAEFKSQLKGWIKDVAAGERGAEDAADMFASYIRRSVSAAGLGFNIVSAILQVTGFSQSIVRVGAKHVARGVAAMAASPLQTMKFVNEKSSFMQERARTQFRELNELRNMVGDESAAQRRLRLGTYFLMMRMQRMVDVPTWVGAYEKALEAGKDDATAVALADQAVIDSQGGGMLKDLSKIERGGALSKLFTVFYSYMNTVYNMAAVSTMTPRSRGRLAADYAMLFIVPVVLNYALKKALTPDVDDEEPDMEKIATDLVAEELAFLMGTMVGVREFQNAANAVVGKETAARGYEGPAGLRAIGEAGRFAVQAKQLEFDRAFRRSAINMLGIGLGLPSAQINRTIDGVEALAEGETENPFAVLMGVQR